MSTKCDQCGVANPADIHTCGAGVQAGAVQPVAWRFTGVAGFKRFVTDAQHKAFSPEVQSWYEPFKCSSCTTPAVQEPVASLKEVDVLMMAEAHGIDPSTNGLYGFYIDCISNHPAARPAPIHQGYVPISDDLESVFIEGCGEIPLAWPPTAQPSPVQDLPFGVGGGLVAIKTLLSRDPCVHANTAIEMIDAILKEHPAAPPKQPAPCTWTKSNDPHMPDTFNATCGVVWTFTDGGPAENDVRFCPGCGAVVSVADPEPEEDLFDLAVKADNGGQP